MSGPLFLCRIHLIWCGMRRHRLALPQCPGLLVQLEPRSLEVLGRDSLNCGFARLRAG